MSRAAASGAILIHIHLARLVAFGIKAAIVPFQAWMLLAGGMGTSFLTLYMVVKW